MYSRLIFWQVVFRQIFDFCECISNTLRLNDIPCVLRELLDEDDDGNVSRDESDGDFSDENIKNNDHSDESKIEGEIGDEDNDLVTDNEEFVLGKDLQTIWCNTQLRGMFKTSHKNTVKKFQGHSL